MAWLSSCLAIGAHINGETLQSRYHSRLVRYVEGSFLIREMDQAKQNISILNGEARLAKLSSDRAVQLSLT